MKGPGSGIWYPTGPKYDGYDDLDGLKKFLRPLPVAESKKGGEPGDGS